MAAGEIVLLMEERVDQNQEYAGRRHTQEPNCGDPQNAL
jgi:hypothetical protein